MGARCEYLIMTDHDDPGLARALAPAQRSQRDLIERAAQVLGCDARVLGVWLAGSFGRGDSDEFSDVDLWVVVDEQDLSSFCNNWPTTSEEIAPALLRVQVGDRPVFSHVTAGWLRYDVAIGTPAEIPGRSRSAVKPLYDPAGLSGELSAPRSPKPPDPDRVASLTQEFLRVLGLLPVVVGRGELVVGVRGAALCQGMLVDLMLEDVAVEDRGGALSSNRLLPPDRRQTLLGLPPFQATRQSVIDAHLACAAAFLPLARELHTRCRLVWPQQLEDALRRHLATTLSVALPT
jgi:predicted nucleotidyltransferase